MILESIHLTVTDFYMTRSSMKLLMTEDGVIDVDVDSLSTKLLQIENHNKIAIELL